MTRVLAFHDAHVSIGIKSFSQDALRHIAKLREDQVDVAAVELVKRVAIVQRQMSDMIPGASVESSPNGRGPRAFRPDPRLLSRHQIGDDASRSARSISVSR